MTAATNEPKVSEAYPELQHYTGWRGLTGILKSQSLWAFRYDSLNDPTEIVHAQKFLARELFEPFRKIVLDNGAAPRALFEGPLGDGIIQAKLMGWIVTAYQETFYLDADESCPFCIPYVVSMCGLAEDMDYERENGLLSLWRGYRGKDHSDKNTGGIYAVVFDTQKLEVQLNVESLKYQFQDIKFCDVHYDREPLSARKQFESAIADIQTLWKPGDPTEQTNQAFRRFLEVICRMKHRAFFEEKEVRIVAYPVYPDFPSKMRIKGIKYQTYGRLLKPILSFENKPYLDILSDNPDPLPIKKIIVGPSPNQNAELQRLTQLVDGRIEIKASETPYRG